MITASDERMKVLIRFAKFWGFMAGREYQRLRPGMHKDHPDNVANMKMVERKILKRCEHYARSGRVK